jgi:hypothetical protein
VLPLCRSNTSIDHDAAGFAHRLMSSAAAAAHASLLLRAAPSRWLAGRGHGARRGAAGAS